MFTKGAPDILMRRCAFVQKNMQAVVDSRKKTGTDAGE